MISLDCETTGLDLYHGARPFLVTTCTDRGVQRTWEWDVDPVTRQPEIPPGDLDEISWYINEHLDDGLVLHNAKFDVTALDSVGLWDRLDLDRTWGAVDDTLLAGHLLASNQPHNLTYMASHYVGVNIKPAEACVKRAVQECRKRVRLKANQEVTVGWKIAKKDLEGNPSITNEAWAADMWLPRAFARGFQLCEPAEDCQHVWGHDEVCAGCGGHRYHVVLSHYADVDSSVTVKLWRRLFSELHSRGLWDIYQQRRKLLPIAHAMERRGVTVNGCRIDRLEEEYQDESDRAERLCVGIAETLGKELTLPKGGNNRSLTEFCFGPGGLGLPVMEKTSTGAPSLNKGVIEAYQVVLERGTKPHLFVNALNRKRKRDTAVSYLRSYRRFMGHLTGDYHVLHPNLNPTGTDTLRWSSSMPNEQNISKRGIEVRCNLCHGDGCVACNETGWVSRNLRHAFGPAPGREWWSCDAKNIELRIPAYESGEQELIDLFECPDEAPYYGSTHLLNFHTVYPDIWEGELGRVCDVRGCSCNGEVVTLDRVGPHCKKKFADNWYQYCKNGGFACVPMDTEALTRQGWKTYDQLSTEDEVLSFKDGNLIWTRVRRKVRLHKRKLVKLYNNHFKVVTTPDHRWLGKKRIRNGVYTRWADKFLTTETIRKDHTVRLSAPVDDQGSLDVTPDEAALLGFVYGDGSVTKSSKGSGPARGMDQSKIGFSVKVYQHKPAGVRYLTELLAALGMPYKRYVNRDGLVWVLCPARCRDLWKRAGLWEDPSRLTANFEKQVMGLSPDCRAAWLNGIFEAEGCWDRRGNTRLIAQNKGPLAEGIKLAIFMVGKYPLQSTKKNYHCNRNTPTSIREAKPYVTGQRLRTRELPGLHDVWCLTTDHGTWVMRQGGQIMLTGNCQYGATDRADGLGTADRAFHRPGSHARLKARFSKLEAHNQRCIRHAERYGYVETIPDASVDPRRGYPLLCTRTERGRILPTVPLNYRTQGTACWWMQQAMIRCHARLCDWNARGFDGHIALQVHDELVFDFPQGGDPRKDLEKERSGKAYFRTSNLWRVRELQKLMEQGGRDIGVPTPTSCEYHVESWAEGVTC